MALAFSLSGVGYAALTLPRNSVGTKQLKKGAVTAAKIGRHAVTGTKIRDDSITGAKVNEATLRTVPLAVHADTAASADQLTGVPAAEYARRLWAHVSYGTLARGYGVTSVIRGSTGLYAVRFDRPVSNCAAFATISADDHDYSDGGVNGTIQAYPVIGPGIETLIAVKTTLPDGMTPADYDFNVIVMC